MAINFCMNCGAKLEDDALLCASCGEAVPQSVVYQGHTETDTLDSFDDVDEPAGVSGPLPATGTPNVGAAAADTTVVEEVDNPYVDFTGFDVLNTHPSVAPAETLYTGNPNHTGVFEPVQAQRSVTEFVAPEREKKSHLTTPIKVAAGIAAVALVASGIGLLAQPQTQSAIQQMVAASESSAMAAENDGAAGTGNEAGANTAADNTGGGPGVSGSLASSTSSSSVESSLSSVRDAKAVLDDDTAYEKLVATYEGLQSYNQRVYACLQTYNGAIFSSDKTQRSGDAAIANALLSEIDKEIRMLDSMNIGRASELYDDYENVRRLLDDQYQRLAVVCESWDISLRYATPYQHQDEILEPLTRDVGPTGVNSYLEDFDNTYWNSYPVAPLD